MGKKEEDSMTNKLNIEIKVPRSQDFLPVCVLSELRRKTGPTMIVRNATNVTNSAGKVIRSWMRYGRRDEQHG